MNDSKKIIKNIVDNYKHLEKSIVEQLALSNKLHGTTTGTSREDIWLQLFEMIIPKKFVIEHSVFIMDSSGHFSKEVDLAIVDNMYTPYIFQYGRLKFIPIEAVAAVIECKSSSVTLSKEDDSKGGGLDAWCQSITGLQTANNGIARMAASMIINGTQNGSGRPSTQTATRPIRIFCGYQTKTHLDEIKALFDFVLIADHADKPEGIEIFVNPPSQEQSIADSNSLNSWYQSLNHAQGFKEGKSSACNELNDYSLADFQVKDPADNADITLLTLNFQLNQLLMLLNNPILFPHQAYIELFNSYTLFKENS